MEPAPIELFFGLLPFFLLPIVLGLFVFLYLRQKQRAPEEEGKAPLASGSFSGIIGIWRYKGPFIRVTLYEDLLVISYAKKIILRPHEIESIVLEKKWSARVVQIAHSKAGAQRNIKIFMDKTSPVFQALQEKFALKIRDKKGDLTRP